MSKYIDVVSSQVLTVVEGKYTYRMREGREGPLNGFRSISRNP